MSLKGTAENQFLLKGAINTKKTVTVTAYEIAVKNGFEGTEQEWLESLRGSDADIEVDSLSELHAWSKYLVSDTPGETEVTSLQLYHSALSNDGANIITYADKATVSNGIVTLVEPTYKADMTQSNQRGDVKGKYIYCPNTQKYYRIPSTSTVTTPSMSGVYTVVVDKAYQLEPQVVTTEAFDGIVVSENRNAYPDDGVHDGYKYVYNGTLNDGGGVTVLQSKTVTPSASQQVVKYDSSYDGLSQVTVAGDSDLVASNIKKGVNIFGVAGSYEGSGGTTLPTLTTPGKASDLASGKQLIDANGNVVTGTHECEGGITPSGTKIITSNGTHNVAEYEFAKVEVAGGGDVVYGEDIEVDSLSELHTWSKYTIGGTVNETVQDSLYVDLAQKGSVDGRVYYADDYSVADGALALSNPTLIDLYDSIQADREVILGKYINLVKKGGYYRVPSDAVITASKPSTGYHYISIAPVYKVSYSGADGEFVGIVVSEDSSAYPQNGEQGGYKYVYNGTIDNAGGCDHVTVTQAMPSLTVSESGLITVKSEQEAGLVSAGTNTVTRQLPTQSAVAVKPGTTSKTAVAAGKYTTGDVTVMGDPDLVAENIRSGVDIFGVTGTYKGGADTLDATLTAAQDLLSGVVAYGKDGKRVEGTAKDSRAWYGTYSADPEIYTSGEYKYVMLKLKPSETTMVRDTVELCAGVSKFGDASAGDVVKGKTFTSKDGLKVAGTIDEYGNDGNSYGWEGAMPYTTEQGIGLSGTARSDMLFRKGCKFALTTQPSNFGDATAADVLVGKTFTSAAGVKVVGTMPPSNFAVTDDGAGNVTITSSAITDNDGNVVIA